MTKLWDIYDGGEHWGQFIGSHEEVERFCSKNKNYAYFPKE